MKQYLFITGKLAAKALEKCLQKMKPDFCYDIITLNCTVAAFMTLEWIAGHLDSDLKYDSIIIPGLCEGDLYIVEKKTGACVQRGPKDLKDLPLFFGKEQELEGYGEHKIKIIAEIVDAFDLSLDAINKKAEYYNNSGADIIDLGCPANGEFRGDRGSCKIVKRKRFYGEC